MYIRDLKTKIEGMAFDRQDWMRHTRNRLCGALGEYAKVKFAALVNFPFDWEPEVQSLMVKVIEMFDAKKIKLKGKYDLKKMFAEVLSEVSGEQVQITHAKNDFVRDYIKSPTKKIAFLKKARSANYSAESLLFEMLEKYASDILKKYR